MKKLLYGTTALVAAGVMAQDVLAAEKIKLGVGGYFVGRYTVGSQDDSVANGEPGANRHNQKIEREAEIHFSGKTTLDNGIDFGVDVQLEAETCGDQVDETYIWADGAFGRFVLGSENAAPYMMYYGAPAPTHGLIGGLNDVNIRPINIGTNRVFNVSGTIAAQSEFSGDSEKLTYYTPRIAGFQLGVSYTPNNCEEANTGDCAGTYGGFQPDNTAGQWSEIVEAGLNYVQKFGDFDVALYGGYSHGNLEANSATASDDRVEWGVGGELKYAGFTFGAAYKHDDLGTGTGATVTDTEDDLTSYNVGLRYAVGPWGVGVQYAHQEVEFRALGGGGEDEVDAWELGGSYALGPGVNMYAAVQFWDLQASNNFPGRAQAGAENDATVFFIGTILSF